MAFFDTKKICDNYREQRSEIYTPLLKWFAKNNGEQLLNSGYPWAPFIPYAFSSYGTESPKIFYIGIDTRGWDTRPQDILNCQKVDNFEYLFRKNDNTVTSRRILIDWANDRNGFWKFVSKLHLFIRTGKLYSNQELRELSLEEFKIIDEIGYGNLNSMELPETLQCEKKWENIDQDLYDKLKTITDKLFDPLKNILDVYSPDYIFILTSNFDEEKSFARLKYKKLEAFNEGSLRTLYNIKGHNTKIIRSSHPRRFSFLSTNPDKMAKYLAESIKLFDE